MNIEQIKRFRDTFRPIPGVVIDIMIDNLGRYHDGLKGQVAIWDDATETLVGIRENNMADQHTKPWDLSISTYDDIQGMSAHCNLKDIKAYLDAMSYDKKEELLKYLSEQSVSRSSITGATGDGIDYSTPDTKR